MDGRSRPGRNRTNAAFGNSELAATRAPLAPAREANRPASARYVNSGSTNGLGQNAIPFLYQNTAIPANQQMLQLRNLLANGRVQGVAIVGGTNRLVIDAVPVE